MKLTILTLAGAMALAAAAPAALARYSMIAWVVLYIVPDQSVTPMTSSFHG